MQIKEVVNIESLDVGYLIHKGGGSAKFTYAAKSPAQMLDTVAEVYGYRIVSIELEPVAQHAARKFPVIDAATQALIDHTQASDEAVS